MSKKYYDIMTPTWGRLVGGSTTKPQTKDYEGQPLVYKSGAKEGQPRNAYFIPVAINKNDPELVAIKSIIHAAAKEGFPDLIGDEIDLELDFSFKITDGDSAKKNKRGHKPCDNEGYPGHWVLNFSSDTPPQCYHNGRLCDPAEVKPGDYVQVMGSVCENGSVGNPGVFLNHDAIQLIRQGDEIKFRPDAAERFAAAGGDTSTVPDWVKSAAPAPTPAAAPPMPPTPAAAPPMPPTPPTTAGPCPMPNPPKLETRYIYNDKQFTKEQLVGWSDAQLATLEQIKVDVNDIPF